MRLKSVVRFLTVLIGFCLFFTTTLLAQPGDPGGDPDVPISGVEILLALGGVLGIRRLFISKRSK